jgi:methyltransferase (TIGR00027 family)
MDWRKIVQDTAFDAVEAKCSASSKGYYSDPFIQRFLVNENTQPPHLNYLYHLRTKFVHDYLLEFYAKFGGNSQVVVLGCGYDTLFWRSGVRFAAWFDLDLPEVIVRKLKLISRDPALDTERYFARSIDLRGDFAGRLLAEGFDPQLPTFFIDEFSMIYVEAQLVERLMKFAASPVNSYLISIGACSMDDDFGRFWIDAFRDNNTPLNGLNGGKWESIFERAGFASVTCASFDNEAKTLPPQEAARVAALEVQEKADELNCLLRHYSVIRCSTKSAK